MTICLVRCPAPFLIDDKVFPPLGLLAVGTALKLQGFPVVVHDGPFDQIPMDHARYGFGPTSPEYPYAVQALKRIKAHDPKKRVVIGGPFASLTPGICLQDGFDAVVVGDGEYAAQEAFFTDTKMVIATEHPLDWYPIPDRTLIDVEKYVYHLDGRRATSLVTGRGCPYQCAFCCKNYATVRLASARKVIEEIRYLHEGFGFTALLFPEDIFVLDRRRTDEVAEEIKRRNIIWRFLARADLIVKYGQGFVDHMAECGCVEVGMGIESGSNRILKTIKKGESAETMLKAIQMLQTSGIRVKGFIILGLPGESHETVAETRAFLDQAQMADLDVKIYQPYPGSRIYAEREKFDITWTDTDLAHTFYKGRPGEYEGTVATSSLTTQELVDEWKAMELAYKRWK